MRKVLIFGINGYLGGLAASALGTKGYCVDGVGTTEVMDEGLRGQIHKYFKFTKNICDLNVNFQQYDVILFFISLDHNKSEDNYRTTIDINCGILSELVQLARKQSNPPTLVYLSTQQVYRNQNFEENIVRPKNIYGLTHYLCEQILTLYPKVHIIRPANVYGPPKTERANIGWTLIASLCQKIALENKMIVKNDGSAIRNFLFSEDYQDMLLSLVSDTEIKFGIHDFIGSQTTSVGYVKHCVEVIQKERNKNIQVILPEDYQRSTENITKDYSYEIGPSDSRKIWVGRTSLKTGITKTLLHYEGM